MPLLPVYGHESALEGLASSITTGRFPQAVLLSGPSGAGKQRVALWLAQALLCSQRAGRPCERCSDCKLAANLAHPDLHWFLPIARPKAGDHAKQVDEVRDLLAEAVTERRATGRWGPSDGTTGHWQASVRLLQRIAALTPFRDRGKVLVVGDAERLVVQDANLEAANALLKILEEPPADTTLILTAAEPRALLPTIRSRVVPVRIGRVPDDVVRQFALAELDPAPQDTALDRMVAAADGRIGLLLGVEGRADLAERARGLLESAAAGPVRWAELALRQPPWGARGDFAGMLDALAVELQARLAQAAARGDRTRLRHTLAALTCLETIREGVGTNANPQLALAELGRDLERAA
jgi:DNA polymerase III subunit delta'